MNMFTVGVLTISDRCHRNEAVDESGPTLVKLIQDGVVKNATIAKTYLVPDCQVTIEKVLGQWCDENITLILTTGGTGVSERDVTPEATAAVVEKSVPGISLLMFKECSKVTPLAALSRGLAGVRGRSLIINLPGSKKACKECLEAVACVIPHAVDLINEKKTEVETVHMQLKKKSSVVANRVVDRSRVSPYPAISVEEAQNIVLTKSNLLKKEISIGFDKAFGHILSKEIIGREDRPAVNLSLKDGYAVNSADGLSQRTVVSASYPGDLPHNLKIPPFGCVRVSTGGPIPVGADCVVEVEETNATLNSRSTEEVKIELMSQPFPNLNILKKGSDYTSGSVLLKSGILIKSAEMGVVAAINTSVQVFRKTRVAVMSTGDELVSPCEDLKPGKVRDSNRIMLISLLNEENFEVEDLGIVKDHPDLLREALEIGFQKADVVVTTGSMSMGEKDYLKEIIKTDFSGEIFFGRVHLKPGKPTAFGLVHFANEPKLWFGLPGNPASSFVTSHLFLLPALRMSSGWKNVLPPSIWVTLKNAPPLEDRPHYVRCQIKYDEQSNKFLASVADYQSSSWIGTCTEANGLILCPQEQIHRSTQGEPSSYRAFLIEKNSIWV